MAFLLPILEGAGAGFLGNALGGLFGGAGGSAENGAMNALNSQDESFQLGMYASEVQNQEQLQVQSEIFDQMMDERSENMREIDSLPPETSLRKLRELLRVIDETPGRKAARRTDDPPSPVHRKVGSDDQLDSSATGDVRRKGRQPRSRG